MVVLSAISVIPISWSTPIAINPDVRIHTTEKTYGRKSCDPSNHLNVRYIDIGSATAAQATDKPVVRYVSPKKKDRHAGYG